MKHYVSNWAFREKFDFWMRGWYFSPNVFIEEKIQKQKTIWEHRDEVLSKWVTQEGVFLPLCMRGISSCFPLNNDASYGAGREAPQPHNWCEVPHRGEWFSFSFNFDFLESVKWLQSFEFEYSQFSKNVKWQKVIFQRMSYFW